MIKNFSIITKIFLVFILIISVCAVTIAINFVLLSSLSQKVNHIIDEINQTENTVFDLRNSFNKDIRAIEEYGNGFVDLGETEKIVQAEEAKINADIKKIDSLHIKQTEQIKFLKNLLDKFEAQDQKIFELKKKGEKNPQDKTVALDIRQALVYFDQVSDEIKKIIDEIISNIQQHKTEHINEFENFIYQSKLLIGAAFGASMLISLLLVVLTAFSISSSIKKIRDAVLKLSQGDFSKRVLVTSNDEIGDVANAFNLMADSIDKTNKELQLGKTNLDQKIKESERRAYQSEVLKELNERMGYSLDLAKIIEIITGSVGRLLDYHVIAYMTEYQGKTLFKCEIKEPVNRAFVADVKNKMMDAFSAMLDKKLKIEDVDESITGTVFNEEVKDTVNSFFNLPLIIGDKVVGVITVASIKPNLYNEEETSILYTITGQTSTAVTKLNEVLEREKGKLNSLVATLDDGVVMLDPHWNLLVINTQARKLLELPEGEVGVFDMLDKLSGKIDIRTKIEKSIAKNEVIAPSEITMGEKIIEVVILRVSGKDKENLGAVVVFHDVTKDRQARNIIEEEVKERTQQLREEQLKLRASVDSLNVGFFIVDPSAEIVMINPVAKRVLCTLEHQQLKGVVADAKSVDTECKMADIEKDLKNIFDLRAQINQSIKERKPIEVRDIAYKNLFLHIFISPIVVMEQQLEVIGAVVLVEDITEAKVMERSKDEFFSIASHELRTPLTAIRGNTSMIKQFYAEQLKDQDLKDMIEDIHSSSVRLIEIVNDFLDVSRLEQGKIEYKKEAFDANGLVSEVVKELTDIATEKKVYIKAEPGIKLPFVFADRNKTKQILLNLAGNSVKFTESGGVTITCGLSDNFVKVSISDTGRGISLENQKLLFRKFQQASSSIITRDTTKGTGLGLYISKLIIEGMGGKISLEKSEEGKGTTFAFTIPIDSQVANAVESTTIAV